MMVKRRPEGGWKEASLEEEAIALGFESLEQYLDLNERRVDQVLASASYTAIIISRENGTEIWCGERVSLASNVFSI